MMPLNQGCGSGYFVNLPLPPEPGLYLIYELADKHDYHNQQFTIYKGTLLVKMIA